ncbi:hypothetical protein IWX48DRAFT_291295 [Phyllosticta citricarpa]
MVVSEAERCRLTAAVQSERLDDGDDDAAAAAVVLTVLPVLGHILQEQASRKLRCFQRSVRLAAPLLKRMRCGFVCHCDTVSHASRTVRRPETAAANGLERKTPSPPTISSHPPQRQADHVEPAMRIRKDHDQHPTDITWTRPDWTGTGPESDASGPDVSLHRLHLQLVLKKQEKIRQVDMPRLHRPSARPDARLTRAFFPLTPALSSVMCHLCRGAAADPVEAPLPPNLNSATAAPPSYICLVPVRLSPQATRQRQMSGFGPILSSISYHVIPAHS